jgi:hypothetical protein
VSEELEQRRAATRDEARPEAVARAARADRAHSRRRAGRRPVETRGLIAATLGAATVVEAGGRGFVDTW